MRKTKPKLKLKTTKLRRTKPKLKLGLARKLKKAK